MGAFSDTDSPVVMGGTLSVAGVLTATGGVTSPIPPQVSGNKGVGVAIVAAATLAIPVTHRIVSKATGGAEALTLADGVPGQELTIILTTDGGDGTLTPATKTGWLTCVFADVKDTLNLLFVDATVGWIVTGYSGTAAPPVLT